MPRNPATWACNAASEEKKKNLKARNLPFEDYTQVCQRPSVTLCLQSTSKSPVHWNPVSSFLWGSEISWGHFHPLTRKGQPRIQEKEQFFFKKTPWQTFGSLCILSDLPLTVQLPPPQKEDLKTKGDNTQRCPWLQVPESHGHTERFLISQGNWWGWGAPPSVAVICSSHNGAHFGLKG